MDQGFIATMTFYLVTVVKVATPLTFAGLGETISEKSGILNISIEANMLAGAFAGFMIVFYTHNLLLGFIVGILAGIVVSFMHAVMSIKVKADQTVIGLALNFLLLGLSSFLFFLAFGRSTELPACTTIGNITIPLLSKIPIIGDAFFNQDLVVYLSLISIVVIYFIVYKTEWGVVLLSIGEHPKAADAAGLNVFKTRYLAGIVNGALCGLGGAYMTLGQFGFFIENITAGRGYIALAIVVLGRRNPIGIFLSALIIGFAESFQYTLQMLGVDIPSQVFTMFPYVIAVLVLLTSIGNNRVPSALGIPYERGER